MAAFALSCVALLLFLWLQFGGPIPLQPEGYRFTTHLPESASLAGEADVRIAGLNVGKVKGKVYDRNKGMKITIELDDEFAPIPANTQAMMRQKALLGEIYIELAPGDGKGAKLADGGELPPAQVEEATQIDEIIKTLGQPDTRRNFQGWVRELAKAIGPNGRGEDLNNAFGWLDDFAGEGSEVLAVLDAEKPALQRLIKNSGEVFKAINEREGQFGELVVNANDFFGALASRNDALAETIEVFPTFLDESRVTVERLGDFTVKTQPLVRDLTPVARELRPTLVDLGRLAPDLRRLFQRLGPIISESGRTLPSAARFLRGAEPLFGALHAYLPELNPILSFANFEQKQVADFIMNGAGSLNATLPPLKGEGPRHYLRQFSISNARGVGVQTTRPVYERGNSYPAPNYLSRGKPLGAVEAFDCKNTGRGEVPDANNSAPNQAPPCFIQPKSLWDGKYFPRLGKGQAPLEPPPGEFEGTAPASPKR